MPAIPVPINISEPGSGVCETGGGAEIGLRDGPYAPGVAWSTAGSVGLATGAVVPAEFESDGFPGTVL